HETADSLNNLGTLLYAMGDLAGARPCYEQALAIYQKVLGNDHPNTATSLYNLATLYIALDQPATAMTLMQRAEGIHDPLIGQILSTGPDRPGARFLHQVQGIQAAFLSLVWRHRAGSPEAVRAALDLALRRKGVTAEALAVQRDAVLGGAYPQLEPRLR